MMTRRRLARELWWLRTYAVVSACAIGFVFTAALRPQAAPKNLGEITVERINVVDSNGTVRLVIANKDRMPPGRLNGKTIGPKRNTAGLIFYNDDGDENGGFIYRGDRQSASMSLTFDQYKQDQTVGLTYTQGDNGRMSALRIWDRPDAPLDEFMARMSAARTMPDQTARDAALKQLEEMSPERVFIGKRPDRAAVVSLADAAGRPRLSMRVAPDGAAVIEFLDERGQVLRRLSDRQ